MASSRILEIPWGTIQPDAQTIINYHVAKYAGKVLFKFVTEDAWPIGRLAVLTGTIATAALWWTCLKAEENSSWILQVLSAIMTSGGCGVQCVAYRYLDRRVFLAHDIMNSLDKVVVWKAISNDTAAATIERHIHTLFEEMNVLNGHTILYPARLSVVGFSLATIIYFWAKKKNNNNYRAQNDNIFHLMGGNLALAFLFGWLVREKIVLRATLGL